MKRALGILKDALRMAISRRYHIASLALTAAIIFVATDLPFIIGKMPERTGGPPLLVGFTNWLWINLGKEGPYVEGFFWPRLVGEICIALAIAYVLLTVLNHGRLGWLVNETDAQN